MTSPLVFQEGAHSQLLHWLRISIEKMDARVTSLMAQHPGVSLGLSNLARRDQLGAAHIHITRYLPAEGLRLTDLAAKAGITKQAMGALVSQCEAWGMVERKHDPQDARARIIRFTPVGAAWLNAYHESVAQAEQELCAAVGQNVATVIALGLEAYGADSE